MELFEQNLKCLQSHDPELAKRVALQPFPENVEVIHSKDGFPVPRISGVALHSQYYPLREAEKTVEKFVFNPNMKTVVYGVGFGYHVQALLQKCSGEITVVEPLMTLFRAFMASLDIRPFLPQVRFRVAETPACLISRLEPDSWNTFKHLPSIRLAEVYYHQLDEGLEVKNLLNNRKLKVMIVNPVYGGSLPTAHYCAGALSNMGHEVATVDCEEFAQGFSSLKNVTRNSNNSEILSRNFMNLMGEIAVAKAVDFQPDLVLALAQAPLTPEAIQRLKALKVPVVFWFVEDYRTLPYWNEIASSYDHMFTLQEGEFHNSLRSKGVQNYYCLPQACFSDIHKHVETSHEENDLYRADISFMGAAYHNRVQSFPRLMDLDFKIWGTDWNLQSPLGRLVQNNNERLSSEEIVKIYSRAKINLNLHSSTYHYGINPDGDFVNPRTFEIAACRGFQLVDSRKDLGKMFKVGEEIIAFDTLDQMREQIEYYLDNQEERDAIALNGYQRVLKEHTMEHRMQELLLQVFIKRKSDLESIGELHRDPLDYCLEQAGENTDLGQYLKQFKGQNSFSLNTVVDHIHKGEGALDQKETLFLMMNQIVKEKF
jgi:spore maturation protein CgeB